MSFWAPAAGTMSRPAKRRMAIIIIYAPAAKGNLLHYYYTVRLYAHSG